MTKYLRIAAVIILALAIVLSCTLVGSKLTDPATYAHTIEALDENRATVLGLTAASAAASRLYIAGSQCCRCTQYTINAQSNAE